MTINSMWIFIFGGTLYLIGVAMILVLRPSFMFTPDGDWKEFGIGKSSDKYTPFPFWLFCLVWALISYIIVLTFNKVSSRANTINSPVAPAPAMQVQGQGPVELPKGYYMLNKKATKLAGVPKYVYLGEEEPLTTSLNTQQ